MYQLVKYRIDCQFHQRMYNIFLLMVIVMTVLSCSNSDEVGLNNQSSTVGYTAFMTRAQGIALSLNQDAQDHEDKVVHLRLMAFEHATGKVIYNKVHPIADFVNYAVKVPLRIGEYDFCFVANENTELTTALNKITFKDALYYDDALTKIAYKGVNHKPDLFFMTAEVTGIISSGNTENNPLKIDVNLVRCLAKVNISMDYKTNMTTEQKEYIKDLRLTSILFKNLPKTYSLFPPKSVYTGELTNDDYAGVANASYSDEGVNPVLRKAVYIPEHLRSLTDSESSQSAIVVSYRKHGIDRSHTVVIDHQNWNKGDDTYTPGNKSILSTKSIVRNTSYFLSGTLEGWEEEFISFGWEILPWTVISSFKGFAAVSVTTTIVPQQDVEVQDPNELLWHSGSSEGIKIKVDIKTPAGGVWRFTITNHNDFSLTGRMVNTGTSTVTGIAGSGPVELTITPLKPWTGKIRMTELYMTINGVEVQIVPQFIQEEIEPGPTHRYLIKQVN